jgi:hypothetical protein
MTPERNRLYTLITAAMIVLGFVAAFAVGIARRGGF